MRQIRHGRETFGVESGEAMEILVSEPGEFNSLAGFASRTILSCSLIGYEIVLQAPRRTLAELEQAGWIAECLRRYAEVELPPPVECPLYANVEGPNQLVLAIGAGQAFVAFCWQRDTDWLAWRAQQLAAPEVRPQ